MRSSWEVAGVGVAQRLVSGRQLRTIHAVLFETRQQRQHSIDCRGSCFGLTETHPQYLGSSTLSIWTNALKDVRVYIKLGELQ